MISLAHRQRLRLARTRREGDTMDSVILLLRFLLEVAKTVFDYRDKRKARRANDGPPAGS